MDRDTIEGGAGADTLDGREGHDALDGGVGDDTLSGGTGDDELHGGDGNDSLSGGPGTNALFGDAGNDTLSGNGTLEGGTGNDTLSGDGTLKGEDGDDKLTGNGTLLGGLGIDLLQGGGTLKGEEGADILIGSGTLEGGEGDDRIGLAGGTTTTADGGLGNDTFVLPGGPVFIPGSSAIMVPFGGGTHTIVGRDGDDQVNGGSSDLYTVNFDGGVGNDSASVVVTNGTFTGGEDDDTLTVSSQGVSNSSFVVTLDGGNGSDSLKARLGLIFAIPAQPTPTTTATMIGGDGNDQIVVEGNDHPTLPAFFPTATVDAGVGDDTVGLSLVAAATVDLGDGADTLTLAASANKTVTLGAGVDTLTLSGWDNAGAVTVTDFAAGAAGDKLDISAILTGNLIGWDGDANPFGTSGFLRLIQDGADALLQVDRDGAAANANTFTTILKFQNVIMGDFGRGNILPPYPLSGGALGATIDGNNGRDNLSGTTLADTISSGDGNDNIQGGDGDDLIFAGSGNDLLDGGLGADVFYGGEGIDVVAYSDATSGVTVNMLHPSGGTGDALGDSFANIEVIVGSNFSDTLIGGGGGDTLEGDAGNDTVDAGVGDDTIVGGHGEGDDTYIGGDGIDTVTYTSSTLGVSVNLSLPSNQATGAEIGTDQLISIENVTGGSGNDVITGDANANVIKGDSGNDMLTGGAGDDMLDGGDGIDTAVYSGNAANYTIVKDIVNSAVIVTDNVGSEGADTLRNVDKLQFDTLLMIINDAPVVTTSGGTTAAAEQIAIVVDPDVAVSDTDNATLTSALVSITAGFQAGQDVLAFVNNPVTMGNIAASYNDATGVLSLSSSGGTATLAQWQAALRSVTYTDTSDTPNTANRTVTFQVDDGQALNHASTTSTKTLSVAAINDAPVVAIPIADQSSPEDQAWSFLVPANAFSDIDSGTLTYTATLGSGAALLAWLSFNTDTRTFSGTPPQDLNGALDLKVTASDGALSVSDTFTLTVQPVNDAPVVAAAIADQSSPEDQAWSFQVPSNAFSDVDSGTLSHAATLGNSHTLPAWLSFNTNTRTFSGAPPQDFNGALDLKVTASDGALSASDTFSLTIQPVNDAPVVGNPIADQSSPEDQAWSFQVPSNTFSDVDSGTLSYTATLGNGDVLPAWLSFNTNTRTFSGMPPQDFNGALDLKVTAGDGALSASDTFSLTIQPVNDAPVVATSGGTTEATGQVAVVLDAGVTVSDVDNTTLTSATVSITGNFHAGEDLLAFSNNGSTMGNIAGNYNAATGVLSLSSSGGTATLAQWQAALRAVTYFDLTSAPNTAVRTVAFQIDDGQAVNHASTTSDKTISVVAGTSGSDTIPGTEGPDTLDGLNGDDLLEGLLGDDHLNGGAGNDLLFGGGGNDVLTGGADGDFMDSGGGTDSLDGGDGFDIASWLSEANGVTLNLANQSLNAGSAAGDTVDNVEAFYLTNSADNFIGGSTGMFVYSFGGDDTFIGSSQSDFLDGGAGADTIDAGSGFDYVSYNSASDGVTLDLRAPANNTGDAAGDAITNAEAYILTEFNDTFIGLDAGQNIVSGYGGNDTLTGGFNANNWFFGGDGNDRMMGGGVADLCVGGNGADTIVPVTPTPIAGSSVFGFETGVDQIEISRSAFGLSAGYAVTAGSTFAAGTSPTNMVASPTFLYYTDLGLLYFDPDGTGATAATLLMQLAGASALAASDFHLV